MVLGDDMLYTAILTKKKRLFQRAYTIENHMIYITDTRRAKMKFLKSGIRNVVFNEDIASDDIFSDVLKPFSAYDEDFLFGYLEEMILHLTAFLKLKLPVDTLAVSHPKAAHIAAKYAKTVIVTDRGEDEVVDGVNIIYSKRLKRMPDMAVILNGGALLHFPRVPTIDLGEGAKSSRYCATYETMCFKCSLLPYEISASALMYLLHKEEDFSFELTGLRKKLPLLFTF